MDLAAIAAGPQDSLGSTMRAGWSSGRTGPDRFRGLNVHATFQDRTNASVRCTGLGANVCSRRGGMGRYLLAF